MTKALTWNWNHLFWYPLLGFMAILSLFALFNIDHGLQDWLYQIGLHHAEQGFPFQNSKPYNLWLHDRIKIFSNNLLWLVLLAALCPEKMWPQKIWPQNNFSWTTFRMPLLIALLAMITCASTMRSLKDSTGVYCPVQLQEYGGSIELHPKIKVGHLLLMNNGDGHCWPGGHSTAGFAWLALFFAFFHMGKKRAAMTALITALVYGHFLGLVQVLRGQHFLSHQFCTMAICWLIGLGFFTAWQQSQQWWQNRKKISSGQ